uniref:XIAP associated factor 1 n=1 Tax=Nannospalax galili TaxID=1026970 RepID=A0A8C6W420_NANGA
MEGDFQECRNCKRSVASVHFTLHEAHCLRFLVLCSECEEPIPKGKMKEHLQDAHQQKKCPISKTVKYHQDGKPQIPPSSLPHQAAGNQTSAVEKDVRPKAKNRNRFPHGTVGLPLKSEIKPRGVPTGDETAYDILQRCSQCGILLPLPTLRQHQVPCFLLTYAPSSPDWESAAQCLKDIQVLLRVMVHAFNPNTWEAEAGGSL